MQLHTFNHPPHLPDFDDMDPDSLIEVLISEEDGKIYTEEVYAGHDRQFGDTRPWRRTKNWIPKETYSGADFAWALSRILENLSCSRALRSLRIGLTDEECRRIYSMRGQAMNSRGLCTNRVSLFQTRI